MLSNYQEELAEAFQDEKELVLYGSEEECIEKARWYLMHEEERQEIAFQGWKKVQQEFSYKKQIRLILSSII